MDWWCSDQGSHFKNSVVKELSRVHGIRHHFTTAYSPWANGTVERVMREIKRACAVLLGEFKLAPQDWPSVIYMVQTILNSAPLKRLGKNEDGTMRTPLQVMTGLRPSRNLIELPLSEGVITKTITETRAMQIICISDLQLSLENMHREVNERKTSGRKTDIDQHNKRTNIVQPNFSIGDLVLVRHASNKGHKLSFKWQGPHRVVDIINEMVYKVEDIITKKVEQVHATRINYYRADWAGKTITTKLLEDAKHSTTKFETIDEFIDIGEEKGEIWIQIKWDGLPDKIDFTWQRLSVLVEDVPEMVEDYLKQLGPSHELACRALKTLSFDKSKDMSGAV